MPCSSPAAKSPPIPANSFDGDSIPKKLLTLLVIELPMLLAMLLAILGRLS